MQLKLLVPNRVLLDQPVVKITAEAETGSFCLLPHHIDFVTSLALGILIGQTPEGSELFFAVDGGIMVKCGSQVRVSTRNAFQGSHLDDLRQAAEQQFAVMDEQERLARSAIARLEASLARQFTALTGEGG